MKNFVRFVGLLVMFSLLAIVLGCSAPAPTTTPKPSAAPAPTAAPVPSAAPAPAPTPSAKPAATPVKTRELKLVTPGIPEGATPKDDPSYGMGFDLLERLEKKTGGALKLKYLGASEVIPSSQLVDAVRNGVVDIVFVPASYAESLAPEGKAYGVTRINSVKRRAVGFEDIVNQAFQVKNMYIVMNLDSSAYDQQFRIFLNKKIEQPEDLKGLRLRGGTTYNNMLNFFGAKPVSIDVADMYTALERSLIDGFCYPAGAAPHRWALDEVTKYYVSPGFGTPERVFLMNLQTWKSIPADLQKVFMNEVFAIEKEYETKWLPQYAYWLSEYQKKGMQELKLSTEAGNRLLNTFYDATWKQLITSSPTNGTKLRELAGLPPLK